jgi:trans-L-3-hydroxyproline dehydratase
MDLGAALTWSPPEDWGRLVVIDSHTGGEPFRLVVSGLPPIPGETVLARRRYAVTHLDPLRRALMWEPRGHFDMYGGWVGPPVNPGSDLSVLFTHNEGFSTMCGHGIIALTKVVFDTGILGHDGDQANLVIDTPAGTVTATARFTAGLVEAVTFLNVPSFVVGPEESVDVPGIGSVPYRLAFGGAFYAYVDVTLIGFDIHSARALVEAGSRIKAAVSARAEIRHPVEDDLGFLYGVLFTGPARDPANHSTHVCVFAEGELDRSPTGTGVSGRLAILHADGEIEVGQTIGIESIVGSVFNGRVIATTAVGPHPAILPEVTGTAHITGRSELWLDPGDILGEGFLVP